MTRSIKVFVKLNNKAVVIMDQIRGSSAPILEDPNGAVQVAVEPSPQSPISVRTHECVEALMSFCRHSMGDQDSRRTQLEALAAQMLHILRGESKEAAEKGVWHRGIEIIHTCDQPAINTPVGVLQCEVPLVHMCSIPSKDQYARRAQKQKLAVKIFDILNKVFGWDRDYLGEVGKLAKKIQSFGDCVLKLSGVFVQGVVYNESIVVEKYTYARGDDCRCWDKDLPIRLLDLVSKRPELLFEEKKLSPEKPFCQSSDIKAFLGHGGTVRLNCDRLEKRDLRMVLEAACSFRSLHMGMPVDLSTITTFFLRLICNFEAITKENRYIGIGIGTDIAKEYGNLFLRGSMYVSTDIDDKGLEDAFEQTAQQLKHGYRVVYKVNSLEKPTEGCEQTLEGSVLKELVIKIVAGSTESSEIVKPVAIRPTGGRGRCKSCDYL